MSESSTLSTLPRSVPTAGEVVGLMARFTAWIIVANALVAELRAVWRGDRR